MPFPCVERLHPLLLLRPSAYHPSGNVEPSSQDIELTRQLLSGAQLLGIPILDHLILGNGNHQSLREITDLWEEFPQGV